MKRVRVVLPALSASVVLAGCGGSGSPAPDSGAAAAPESSPTLRVQAASDTTRQAGSSRFEQTTVSTIAGKEITVRASGLLDPARRLGTITAEIGAPDGTTLSLEQRLVGDTLFVQLPQQPGRFSRSSLAELVGTSLADNTDPTAGFQALEAASDDVTEVGTEQVRGTPTTHYRGTYDAEKALEQVGGTTGQLLEAAVEGSDLSAVPFDAYLDDQGRLRKLVQSLTLTPRGTDQQVRSTSTTEAYDVGTPVEVTAPAPEQTEDGAPLLATSKNATQTGKR